MLEDVLNEHMVSHEGVTQGMSQQQSDRADVARRRIPDWTEVVNSLLVGHIFLALGELDGNACAELRKDRRISIDVEFDVAVLHVLGALVAV